ncbi:uncharacterized protein EAE97_011682 [Botrytis byssoidea]|uniref:BZIP domain-containing protein n=1 Tax=Botrytis byssoidea TaxID=139641 RepID=A0A9P5HXR2_9HELO|nr:uncharacterized protein EAE97_011682 [Botrytis byssoidea]KAF7919350.1 hypothetical protein EAE97_011682 [Botrytis byssoidea]
MAKSPFAAQITLQYTLHQDTDKGVEDVRSSVSNAAERRKAQNRVRQKAWRRKKKLERSQFRIVKFATVESNSSPGQKLAPSETSSSGSSGSLEDSSLMVRATGQNFSHSHSDVTLWQEVDLLNVFNSAAGLSQIKACERSRTAVARAQGNMGDSVIIEWLQKWPQSATTMGSPRSDTLLVLVKVNVFRALISNSITLGIPSDVITNDNATSAFCPPSVGVNGILALPPTLRPTDLQTQIPHHPWIDCLPVPQMRQNLIRAGNTYDVMDLCGDLVGLFSAGTGRTGMVIWGEPWDVAGWEVTEGFLERWGWTIKGCWDLFESTNRWRAERGQMALQFDKILI